MVSTESSLPLIARLNIYVIKPSLDIKLDEVFGSTKLWDKLRDQQERVFVLNSYKVKCLVVLDQTEGAVLFLDKEYWSYHGELK